MRKVIFDPEEGRPAEGCTAEPVTERMRDRARGTDKRHGAIYRSRLHAGIAVNHGFTFADELCNVKRQP